MKDRFTPRDYQKGLNALHALTAHNGIACEKCQHPPIVHIEGVCVTCFYLVGRPEIIVPNKPTKVCTQKFHFKLSAAERSQALKADKMAYEQQDICAACGQYWMQHAGYLCPTGDSTFVKLFGAGDSE